ncbi:hypothetical protein BST45_10175 [Mycobacterium shinjukuense]|nr:hypothetical protein BST45_10175 [Mycobacterium shinjukuense]
MRSSGPNDGDPLRPALPRLRSSGPNDGDPLRPALPRLRSPFRLLGHGWADGCGDHARRRDAGAGEAPANRR